MANILEQLLTPNTLSLPVSHRWVGICWLSPVYVFLSTSRMTDATTTAPPETKSGHDLSLWTDWRRFSVAMASRWKKLICNSNINLDQMDLTAFTNIYVGLHFCLCPALHPPVDLQKRRLRHLWLLDSSFSSLTKNLSDRKTNTVTYTKIFQQKFSSN